MPDIKRLQEIKDQMVLVDDDEVTTYRVNMKVTFVLDD